MGHLLANVIIQLWETYLEAVSPLQHIGHVSVIIYLGLLAHGNSTIVCGSPNTWLILLIYGPSLDKCGYFIMRKTLLISMFIVFFNSVSEIY